MTRPLTLPAVSFADQLRVQLDRLSAAGWTRDQIAEPTGYTPRQLLAWASGRACKPALQTGLLVTLRALKGRPPGKSSAPYQPPGGNGIELPHPPERIWLQWHGDGEQSAGDPVQTAEVTWSANKVWRGDVCYVRAMPAE